MSEKTSRWFTFFVFDSARVNSRLARDFNTNARGSWRYGKLTETGLWNNTYRYLAIPGGNSDLEVPASKWPIRLVPSTVNTEHHEISAYYDSTMSVQQRVRFRPHNNTRSNPLDGQYFLNSRAYRYEFIVTVDDRGTKLPFQEIGNSNWFIIHEAWQAGGAPAFAIHIRDVGTEDSPDFRWFIIRSTDERNVIEPLAPFRPNVPYEFRILFVGQAENSDDGILDVFVHEQGKLQGVYHFSGPTVRSKDSSGAPLKVTERRARPQFGIYVGTNTAKKLTNGVEVRFDRMKFEAQLNR